MKSPSEMPVVVPYQTDWTFVALMVTPVVMFGLFLFAAALH